MSMLRDVVVRPTVESDLQAITAIYRKAVHAGAGSFELRAPDVAEFTRRWRLRVTKDFPHIVATSGGTVIGYASARRYRAGPAFSFVVEDAVYVASHAHGHGVGRALLTELIKLCERSRFRQMIALMADENSASVRLHEKLGFRQVGLIEGLVFKEGRWIDTVIMQRALGEGRSSSPPSD